MMHKTMITVAALALLILSPAHAISAKYRQQLENSGCTQASELQGCDITKSKAENAKAAPRRRRTDRPTSPNTGIAAMAAPRRTKTRK
jgi:hypothetical protein